MEETNETMPTPAELKKRKRWLIWCTVLIVLGLILLFLWWLFARPSHGTISTVVAPEKTDFTDPEHRRRYQGKYFTFTYPSDFARREENEAVKHPLLERIYLSRSDIEGRKIAITLQDNTGNTFEEYGSFRIRRSEPMVYREEKEERNSLIITFFTKETSVYEVSAFFGRGNQVLSIAVSSPIASKGLREEVWAVLDSFQWK